jgi:hypothetical protein
MDQSAVSVKNTDSPRGVFSTPVAGIFRWNVAIYWEIDMGTFTLAEFAAFDSRSISPGLVSTILSQDGTPACPRAFAAQKHKTKREEPVCKSPLIATALIALLGSVGTAAAGTMYDWNELSPPQADFMAQQRVDLSYAKGEAPLL